MTTITKGFVAIDPGIGGAIALLSPVIEATDEPAVLKVFSMPVQMKKSGRREIDAAGMLNIFDEILDLCAPLYCMVERVAAMPGQGVSSMFSLGDSFGVARAIATQACFRVEYVMPNIWKKKTGLTSNKAYSLTLARRTYPTAAEFLTRKLDEGRAEALLLARYASIHHEW